MSILFMMNAVSSMMDSRDDLKDRCSKIEGGTEMMEQMVEVSERMLTELRKTIPENQRVSLNNIAKDMEMRMVPKATPSKTSVIMQKEELKALVDAAQVQCRECVLDGDECGTCELYKVLTSVLPLDRQGNNMLCPYNMAVWEN